MKRFLLLLMLLVLCSCAHPTARIPNTNHYDKLEMRSIRRQMRFDTYKYETELTRRINNVHYALVKSTGEELCARKLVPDIGAVYIRLLPFNESRFFNPAYDIHKEKYDDEASLYRSHANSVRIQIVLQGSAAEKAGLKEGDVLLSVMGVPISTGKDAFKKLGEVIRNTGKAGLPFDIEVERDDKTLSFSIAPDMVCPYPLYIDKNSRVMNAFADGNAIYTTIELIDYIEDNNQLAAVIAHELAHNNLGHIKATQQNIGVGLIFGSISDLFLGTYTTDQMARQGQLAYSKDFEFEADYVSVYYMARAGFDYKNTKKIQSSLVIRKPSSLYFGNETHPTPQKRYAVLQEAAKEIDLKKAFNEELLPEFNETNEYLLDKKDF